MTVAFADDLMAQATKIENLVVGTLTTNWKAASPIPIPGLYADPAATRAHFGITEAFQPWSLLPDPAAFQPISAALLQAMGMLRVDAEFTNPVNPSDQLAFARQEYQALVTIDPIGSWTGSTADNFRGKFLSHFKANTENQAILIAVLKAGAEAQGAIWTSARNDITTIARKTLAALQNDGCDQSSWVMLFSVLAGIASIAAVPLSGGTSLFSGPMAVTAIGAVASMATNAIPAMTTPDSAAYQANSPESAVAAMKAAMAALQLRVNSAQTDLQASLMANVSFVDRAKQDLFMMAKPALSTDDPNLTAGR